MIRGEAIPGDRYGNKQRIERMFRLTHTHTHKLINTVIGGI